MSRSIQQCPICDKFMRADQISRLMKIHGASGDSQKSEEPFKECMKTHGASQKPEEPFKQCCVCDTWTRSENLPQHMLRHGAGVDLKTHPQQDVQMSSPDHIPKFYPEDVPTLGHLEIPTPPGGRAKRSKGGIQEAAVRCKADYFAIITSKTQKSFR